MSTTQQLHSSLLRMPIIHILRAAGFHSTRPSVLDTLVNIAERYLLLLAETALAHALLNHNTSTPTLTDVRLALTDCGAILPTLTAAEEDWREKFRRPLDEYDKLNHGDVRRKGDVDKREDEDTADIREFIKWIIGDTNKDIRRIAGVLPELGPGGTVPGEDYLTLLKKKHSKTGEESRFRGSVLGVPAEDRGIRIEGGPVETLADWQERLRDMSAREHESHALDRLAHDEEVAEQQLQIAMDVDGT